VPENFLTGFSLKNFEQILKKISRQTWKNFSHDPPLKKSTPPKSPPWPFTRLLVKED
jgi:hypothetical protein